MNGPDYQHLWLLVPIALFTATFCAYGIWKIVYHDTKHWTEIKTRLMQFQRQAEDAASEKELEQIKKELFALAHKYESWPENLIARARETLAYIKGRMEGI